MQARKQGQGTIRAKSEIYRQQQTCSLKTNCYCRRKFTDKEKLLKAFFKNHYLFKTIVKKSEIDLKGITILFWNKTKKSNAVLK